MSPRLVTGIQLMPLSSSVRADNADPTKASKSSGTTWMNCSVVQKNNNNKDG